MSHVLNRWEPENPEFWQQQGKAVARRNLWISIPALMLAFVIWQVWSVAVLNMPNIGFGYSQNQLFWLAALPALSGATLRIFYSFMVPVWRAQMDGHFHRQPADSGYRHRFCRAGPQHQLHHHGGAGFAVRFWRRQFQFVHVQYQLLFSQGGKGYGAGPECRAG